MSPIRKISSLFSGSQNLKQAVGILFVTVLISNVLGLVRNIVIANRVGFTYGSLGPLDSYYAAFVLPDLFYNFIIVGALATAVLPLLVKLDTNHEEKEFWRSFNVLVSTGITVISVAMIGLFIAMPYLLPYIVPGFTAEAQSETIALARVLLLSPMFFTISQLSSSALQAKRHFATPAIAPIFYNISIIAAALLVPEFGMPVLVLGVIVGAAAHFLIQLPTLYRLGWRFNFTLGFANEQVRHVIKVMIPRAVALTGNQLLLIAFYHIASHLKEGSISIYRLTDDLQTAPVLLLANTLAMAVLPDFARHIAKNDEQEFSKLIGKTVRLILFIFAPVTIFLIIFSRPIMDLYISVGHAISIFETERAVDTFRLFVISLPFQGLILILARSYFARSDTVRPTIYSLISIMVAWALAAILTNNTNLGVAGLSLSFSVASILNAVLLWLGLGVKSSLFWQDERGRANFSIIFGGAVISGLMMLAAYRLLTPLSLNLISSPAAQNVFVILSGFALGLLVFGLWAKVFNLEQWQLIRPIKDSTEK